MEQTKDIFGKRLFEIRESRGESQQELADSIGITRQSLSRYELGERTANIDLLKKVSKHYSVSTDYLLGLTDTPTTDTNLQAVCKFTGLNEKAVETLRKYIIFTDIEPLPYSLDLKEYKKECIELRAKLTNEYIVDDCFFDFLLFIERLEKNSTEWIEECKKGFRREGKDFLGNDETYKLSKECDYATLECNRYAGLFIQKHDKRYRKMIPEPYMEFEAFKDIKKEVLAEMEAEQNGKHNPPKE